MADTPLDARIADVRRFTRFYTRQIGLLQDSFLHSPFSLTEARVLYELFSHGRRTASEIAAALDLDHGYLSRILARFARKKLIVRERAKHDGRQSHISLTARGHKAFAPLDARSNKLAADMLRPLRVAEQRRVVGAMRDIETLIGGANAPKSERPAYSIRTHRSGDMGWVVAQHGIIYSLEYGWNSHIEEITAEIVANFLKNFDPARERCWIAEIDGEIVGSVFLVRETEDVARLRLLIVDSKARGLGIGRRLVQECVQFARGAGYRKITLWTHAVLKAARALYQQAGFKLVEQWVHDDFGKPEPSETWELEL
jgi:DNA-binding MarR family transcriptional regulator/GNAT superfamily N-acetyltransferase